VVNMLVAPESGLATRGVVRVLGLSLVAAVVLLGWFGSRWFDAPQQVDVDMENLPCVELTR
jgi:hypothetical protein